MRITAEAAMPGQQGQGSENLDSVTLLIHSTDKLSMGPVFLQVQLTTSAKLKVTSHKQGL